MKFNVKFGRDMYRIFCVLCFVMFFESMIMRLYGVSAPLAVAGISVIFTIFTAIVYFNIKNPLVYACIAVIIAAARIFVAVRNIGFIDFARGAATDFFGRNTLDIAPLLFICACIAMLLSVLFILLTNLRVVRYVAVPAVAGIFIFFGIRNITVNPAEIFSGTGLIISVLAEVSMFFSYKKDARASISAIISYLIPAVTVVSLCVAFLPMSDSPIRWEGVRKLVRTVKTTAIEIASEISYAFSKGSYEFRIGMQGYSDENGALGGDIAQDDGMVMRIKLNGTPRSSIYLIGNANAEYDGERWSKGDYEDFGEDDYFLDYYETVRSLDRSECTRSKLARISNRLSFSIVYEGVTTKTLFYPLKTFSFIPGSSDDKIRKANPSVTFKKPKTTGTGYILSYIEIDYHSPEFKEIARRGTNHASTFTLYRVFEQTIPDDIEEILDRRAEYIREHYTELPDCITERTYELAREITAGCDNDYDRLAAIEAYLRSYTYTLTPGDIPEDFEPVDYFLFESREGYCTYFATAMAVLARCIDIPTRYINGFAVDYENEISYQRYSVLGSDAHAWPEGYIEGVGWIPFEPTADFSDGRYEYKEPERIDFNSEYTYTTPQITSGTLPGNQLTGEEAEETESDSCSLVIAIILTVLSVALIVFLYFFLRVRAFRKRYERSSETEKFFTCYRMIVYLCEKKCFSRAAGETADSYGRKVQNVFEHENMSFISLTESFDRIRYGGGSAELKERMEMERYLNYVIGELRLQCGKLEAMIVFLGFCL